MGTELSQTLELITLAKLAGRAEADPEDTANCLDSLLSGCQGRVHELSKATARTAVQAISSTAQAAMQMNLSIRAELLSLALEFLTTWHAQSEYIAAQCLGLLEEVAKYLHATSFLPAGYSPSKLSLELAKAQTAFQDVCLRAMGFRTISSILQYSDTHACDEHLKTVVELALAALTFTASAPQDGRRFALQIYAVCCLSPLSDAPSSFPKPMPDFTSTLLSAGAFCIQHIDSEEGPGLAAGSAWNCGQMGHTHIRVEEHQVLIFFGTLPRLLKAFAHDGVAAADEAGMTLLHRLASSNLSRCLEIYLHSCGPTLNVDARNKAGSTAAEVAAASGKDICLALIQKYASGTNAAPTPATSQLDRDQLPRMGQSLEESRPAAGAYVGQALAAVSRAMARAASMPLPPQPPVNTDSPMPSLSWIEPETSGGSGQRPVSQEERLKQYEAQVAFLKAEAQRRELRKPGSASSLSSNEGFRQHALLQRNQPSAMGNTAVQAQTPNDFNLQERKRIVEMALAKLGTGSEEGSDVEPDKSRSAAYFQNPAGSLPLHSNPFATFQEARGLEERGSSMSSHSIDRSDIKIPSMGVLRTGSMGSIGSIGLDRISPPQDIHPHSLSFDSRTAGGYRPLDWEEQLQQSRRASDWESANTPSTRMWLGNIAAHVTTQSIYDVFGNFGRLTDAAVFPARIGPLGYAFVNFMHVEDSARAYEALNNTSVPPLTGSKLLKLRYKPAQQIRSSLGEGMENIVPQPSKHLWLGNIPTRPNKLVIEELFSQFGPVTSVRVFPGKTFAFVNYDVVSHATAAMQHLDGRPWPAVSGNKPMVVRYQAGPPLGPSLLDPLSLSLRTLSVPPPLLGMGGAGPSSGLHSLGAIPIPQSSMHGSLGSAGSSGIGAIRHSSLPTLPTPTPMDGGLGPHDAGLQGPDGESLLPAINLSNRLNPNNMHYDKDLAEMYKNMTKAEKEALWADDRSQQQLLAMQAQDQLPSDLSMLGLPPQQASLLANHLAGGSGLDPWGGTSQVLGGTGAPNWGGSLSSQISAMQSAQARPQQSLGSLGLPVAGQSLRQQDQQPNIPVGSPPMLSDGVGNFSGMGSAMLPQFSGGNLRAPTSYGSEAMTLRTGEGQGRQTASLHSHMLLLATPQNAPPSSGHQN